MHSAKDVTEAQLWVRTKHFEPKKNRSCMKHSHYTMLAVACAPKLLPSRKVTEYASASCMDLSTLSKQALQPLLRDSPVKVQKYVLRQFAQLLPHDVEARRAFVQNGGLQFLQV